LGQAGMKKLVIPGVTALVTFLVAIPAGCQRQDIEISPAPIEDVSVDVTQSQPPQVAVHIKGGLRDTCTTFHDLTVKRTSNTINIKVTVQTREDEFCGHVYTFFEKDVNLGSDFIKGENYDIIVNGEATTFTMP
jgi:hypothetical protein